MSKRRKKANRPQLGVQLSDVKSAQPGRLPRAYEEAAQWAARGQHDRARQRYEELARFLRG